MVYAKRESNSYYILKDKSKTHTMLYFHGNSGNIGTRMPFYKSLTNFNHINILAIDYR